MDDAFKIVRYTLAMLMAGASIIINANAATIQPSHIETSQSYSVEATK